MTVWDAIGLSPSEVLSVLAALLLCGLIGFEREARRKEAGIRTHMLVGLGSCLFAMVSVHGAMFLADGASWDTSRIASQVVTGIGFLGAGVIFFNKDTVRGLTTASAIWVVAAIGLACGLGMVGLAALVVIGYFLVVLAIAPLAFMLLKRNRDHIVRLTYEDGKGVLRQTMLMASRYGFELHIVAAHDIEHEGRAGATMEIRLSGHDDPSCLIAHAAEIDGMLDVNLLDRDE